MEDASFLHIHMVGRHSPQKWRSGSRCIGKIRISCTYALRISWFSRCACGTSGHRNRENLAPAFCVAIPEFSGVFNAIDFSAKTSASSLF
jgi:hypothetical protein